MIDSQISILPTVLAREIVTLEDKASTWLFRVDPTHWKSNVIE